MRRDRLLLIIGLLAAAAYFYGLLADQYTLRLLTKPIPAPCLIAWR